MRLYDCGNIKISSMNIVYKKINISKPHNLINLTYDCMVFVSAHLFMFNSRYIAIGSGGAQKCVM